MASKARTRILTRIRYRNQKLPEGARTSVPRGASRSTLLQAEKTLNAKIQLTQAGVDTEQINIVDTKTAGRLEQVGRSLKVGNKTSLARAVNKLASSNRDRLSQVNQELKDLEGFGSVEFLRESISNRKLNARNKLLEQDTKVLIEAIGNKDFVPDTIRQLTDKTNKSLQLQGLDTIEFDEFDLDDTIKKLNKVDQRTKNIARYVEFDEDLLVEDFTDLD